MPFPSASQALSRFTVLDLTRVRSAKARLRGKTEIIGRYIPTAKNALVRDHFKRLGFIQTGSQDGEITWRFAVSDYCEMNLPLKVDPQPERKLASAVKAGP